MRSGRIPPFSHCPTWLQASINQERNEATWALLQMRQRRPLGPLMPKAKVPSRFMSQLWPKWGLEGWHNKPLYQWDPMCTLSRINEMSKLNHRFKQVKFLLEEPILSPCWICFFDFNLPIVLLTKKILFTHNGLPWRTLPLCLNVKPKCLCLGACPPVGGYRKEEMNNVFSLRLAILRDMWKINGLLTLFPHLPSTLFYNRI